MIYSVLKMVTASSSFVSNEDWSNSPSIQLSLMMTMVMLITFFRMTAGKVNDVTLDINAGRYVDILMTSKRIAFLFLREGNYHYQEKEIRTNGHRFHDEFQHFNKLSMRNCN